MQTSPPTADLLATIVAATRRTVEIRQEREPLASLTRRAEQVVNPRLEVSKCSDERGAQCDRRVQATLTVSRGIACGLRPGDDCRSYASAGAVALSVLTEPTFFDGSLDHLAAVRKAVDRPVVAKGFHRFRISTARGESGRRRRCPPDCCGPSSGRARQADGAGRRTLLDALVEVHKTTSFTSRSMRGLTSSE